MSGSRLTDLQHPWRGQDLDNVRTQDVRRSVVSGGLLIGENLPMVGRLLGHAEVQTNAQPISPTI